MAASSVWRMRWNSVLSNLANFAWLAVIYLTSELIIWALSRTLAPARLEFFASILGMLLVFLVTTAAYFLWKPADSVYHERIKAKVDFINSHLGLGFPIPIIMLDQSQILDGPDIARVVGAFVTTNLASWVLVFLLSILTLTGVVRLRSRPGGIISCLSRTPSIDTDNNQGQRAREKSNGYDSPTTLSDSEQQTTSSSRQTSCERTPGSCTDASAVWRFLAANYAILLSLSGVFVIGVPIAVATQDERFVDAFSLWFIWITSVKSQRAFKNARMCTNTPHFKRTLATIMNPVLVTTLVMTGYTRAKAAAFGPDGLAMVLKTFSSGTPLYALWTAAVHGTRLSGNPSGWFGAGDVALSILECGILTWGLKLSECRRQMFSVVGLFTVVICTAATAGNVFLSVLVSRAMGLDTEEALSFAARSTTLALAKPATEAMGGNMVVNATLVVSNGILGQLLYPFALDKLGLAGDGARASPVSGQKEGSCQTLMQSDDSSQLQSTENDKESATTSIWSQDGPDGDSPVTIATGIAIGINGAAMGVSYLYETKSRAAPYAALAMTIFGVTTVVFTTVAPFSSVVIALASR